MKKLLSGIKAGLLATVALLFLAISSQASHIIGMDLNYQWLRDSTYTITLVVYGDCSSGSAASLSSLPSASPQICIFKRDTSVTNISLTIQAPTTGTNVTPVCTADTGLTQCTNTSYTLSGIREFVYTGTYTLPSRSQYWRFRFNGDMGSVGVAAGRTASITNITTANTLVTLTDTLNNISGGHNTSVSLPVIPTPFYYLNHNDSYNPGASDVDGDTPQFTLINALNGSGGTSCNTAPTAVTYASGTSGTAPLQVASAITFNSTSGQIDFFPNAVQKADVVYNIREFRSGSFVGSSQREMTFIVITASVADPGGVVTGVTGATATDSTHVEACTGTGAYSFHITPYTSDSTDNVLITASGIPSGASFSVTNNNTPNADGLFSWTTTSVAPGTYTFYLTYTDYACPIPLSKTVAYTINIAASPAVSAISGPDSVCVGSTITLTDTATTGSWDISNTAIATVSATGVVTPISVTTATYDTVTYTVTNSCGTASASKVILIKTASDPGTITGPSNICPGVPTTFTASVSGGTWSSVTPGVATVTSGGVVTGVTAGNDSIKYTVTNSCGSNFASKVITVTNSPTVAAITGPTSVCVGSNITLSETTTGGTWGSITPSVASVSTSGVVTGLTAGIDTITYTTITSCGTPTAKYAVTVLPLPNSGTIFGTSVVCQGANVTLTTSGSGGAWSSFNTAIATVSSGGTVTGVAGGVDTIYYTVTNSCGTSVSRFVMNVTSAPDPGVISGPPSMCPGDTSTFTETVAGGTWSSSNTALATLTSTGRVTAVAAGAVNISYSVVTSCGTAATGEALAINTAASAGTITGSSSLCIGGTTPLSNTTTGGNWSSSNSAVASISASGLVTGLSAGIATITYAKTGSCGSAITTFTMTVNGTPVVNAITGIDSICNGGTTTFTNTTTGGVWSSVFTSIATINTTGAITTIGAGTDTIKYTLTTACGTAVASKALKVLPQASAGLITGTPSVCVGATTALSNTVTGGAWSTANAARATITTTGVVYGISAGTVLVSYQFINSCGTATDTMLVTVLPLPTAGTITGADSVCQGATTTLTDAITGGVWSNYNDGYSNVSTSGVVTGVGSGTDTIYYSVTNSCGTAVAKHPLTVKPLPDAGNIFGTLTACPGTTVTAADATPGGVWSSSNTGVATINAAGLITGVTAGTSTISYTVTTSCGSASATNTVTINAVPVAGTISGTTTFCQGATTTLTSSGTTGGTWSSSNTAVATVDGAGVVTGVAGGTANITYNITNVCGTAATSTAITVNPLPNAGTIVGTATICPTATTTLSDAISGGVWSSSNTSVATINSSGFVTAVSSGTTTISYGVTNGCGTVYATLAFTVSAPTSAGTISGSTTVCSGANTPLSSTVTGGTWSASNGRATVNSTTGSVTGVSNGADTITYTVTNTCGTASATYVVTVGAPASAGTITGPTNVCVGSTITLSNTTTGGTWSSSNTLIASVTSAGVVRGIGSGTATISYVLASSCGSSVTTYSVTVSPVTSAGTITGASSVCIGANTTLADAVTGGTWSASNANATVSGGVVTGVTAGTDTISYTVTNACSSATATKVITISPLPDAGSITGATSVCQGASTTLTESVTGGTWSSSAASVASVSSTGVVTGVSGGTATISYTVASSCGSAFYTFGITVTPTLTAGTISGPSAVCIASNITLTTTGTGGSWTSSNATVATVDGAGSVTGLSSGAATISYTVSNSCGSNSATKSVTVSAAPVAGVIGGSTTICVGASSTLTETVSGGTWSSTTPTVATVNSATGSVTGVSAGTSLISYTITTGCGSVYDTATVTINTIGSGGTISGPSTVCIGANISLTDPVAGGTWSSDNVTVASVSTSGTVTGLAAGTATISYSVSSSCGAGVATKAITVSTAPAVSGITGTTNVCVGSTTTLADATTGGTWSSSDNTVATVNASGVVTGIAAGSINISYSVSTACSTAVASSPFIVDALPNAGTISGASGLCVGSIVNLTTTGTGGTWSSSSPSVATVNATGAVTGLANGTTTISYTVVSTCGTATATQLETVSPSAIPGTISGPATYCVGTPGTLSSTASGGAWASSNTSVATISGTGVVSPLSAGTATITYTVTTACGSGFTTYAITVNPAPNAGVISGTSAICSGSTSALSTTGTGGTWSSSNTAVASVNTSGVVAGVSAGSATISYAVTNSCGTSTATYPVTVNAVATAGTIGGPTSICTGTPATLTSTTTGGTWSSSNASVATIGSTSGVVSGLSAGSATITYSVTTSCGSAFTTSTVTVTASPTAGTISGTTALCVGSNSTLTSSVAGGTWSTANSAIASIGTSSGVVTGVSAGSTTVTYSVSNSCGTATATASINVSSLASAGTISGTSIFCAGTSSLLSTTGTGGSWSSSNASVATVSATGNVTGVTGGSATITYSVSSGCGSAFATLPVTVNPAPDFGTISGPTAVCLGSSITLTETSTSGSWSSTNPSVATISAAGVVTPVTTGTTTISYTATNSCGTGAATYTVTVGVAPNAGSITGTPNVCIGSTTTLANAAGGGTWSSSNSAVASVNTSGVVTGVSNGTATISYTVTTSCATASATINVNSNPFPNAGTITGPANVCIGSTATYVDTTAGGTWSSGNTAIATVNSAGVVTGVATGAVNIYYSVSNACGSTNVTIAIHVITAGTAGAITGTTTVCPGATTVLSDTISGGVWSSSDTTIATISTTGIATGVRGGTATISYGVSSSCGVTYATRTLTVTPATDPGTLSGGTTFCPGATSALSATVSGGTWSSSDNAIATVSSTGVVTGVSGGSATISYTVSGTCGSATATRTVNITPATNAGVITGPSSVCLGLTAGLGDTVVGGTWSSSNASVVSVTTTGVITGVAAGTAIISYTVSGTCGSAVATSAITVTTTPNEGFITGATSICAGTTTALTESTTGGVWSSGTPSVATVNTTGVVTGVSGGTVIISYSVSNACGIAVATAYMTIAPLPATGTVSGPSTVCVGSTATLSDTATGGTWSSSDTTIATVSGSGVVTAVSVGAATISYTLTNACGAASATLAITVGTTPASAGVISGAAPVCPGGSVSLSESISGGTWSSSDAAIATVSSTGVVTGVAAGTASIVYTVTNTCGSATASVAITVNTGASAGAISAATTSVCVGSNITLTDAVAGGTWSSGDTTVATISSGGVVTGIRAGTATITYATSGACGAATATVAVNVNPVTALSAIAGPTGVCSGASISLSDSVFGGTWTSSNTGVVTVSSAGSVTGVSSGTVVITYTYTNTFGCTSVATHIDTVSPAPNAGTITGATTTVCAGSVISFAAATAGGTWSVSDATLATVDTIGNVTGIAAGTPTLSYSVSNSCGTASATVALNVNPTPALSAIGGAHRLCAGTTAALTNTISGGTWSSSAPSVVSVDASTGVASAISVGTATISYSVTNGFGCSAMVTLADTVNPGTTAGVITAPTTTICEGATVTFADTSLGGVWTTSNSAVASIDSIGAVTGVASGTATITYTVSNSYGCSSFTTAGVTINPAPVVGAISGPTSMCSGSTATYSSTTSGGTWASSNTAVATIDASGLLTPVATGITNVTYSITNIFTCTTVRSLSDTISTVPVVAAISGPDTICASSTATLTNTTAGGRWTSSDAAIATVDAATGVVSGVSAGAVTISYTVGTGCATTVTFAEVVNAAPTVAPISGTTSVCNGGTSTLADTTSGGTWSSSNPSVASVSATGVVTSSAAGTANISYTVTNVLGCSFSRVATYTVIALPTPSPIVGVTGICLGGSVTLTDALAGGMWSSSNPSVATVDPTTGAVTSIAVGSAVISYTVTDSLGCSGAVATTVTVSTAPTVAAIAGAGSICTGSTATLTDATSGGVWSSSDTTIVTVNASTGVATGVAAGSATITYTYSAAGGCSAFATASLTVTAGTAITPISGSGSVCAGSTTTLTNATTGGTWSSSNSTIATVNASGVVTGVAGGSATITYSVSGTGCPGVATLAVTVGSVSGTLSPASGSLTICHGSPVTVSVTSSTATTYQWQNNSVAIAGATNASYNATIAGVYAVRISDGTCSTLVSGVTVVNSVAPVITRGAGNLLYTGTYVNYQWYRNGSLIAGATSNNYNFTATGNYRVVVTHPGGCVDTSAIYAVTGSGGGGVGVAPVEIAAAINIFPNPATLSITIEAPVSVNVSVLSADGKVVIRENAVSMVDVSRLSGGMYLIMIYDQNNTLLKADKFMKVD